MPAAIRIDLCSTAEVAPGNALKVDKAGLVLAVFNLDGEFFVTDDACTHGPGSLSEGFIEGEVVECNFHNGQFNIKTGEVVAAPRPNFASETKSGLKICETTWGLVS
jgi:nitrite reductase/ring-hydroxylating ferredoxin subunit